MMFQNILTPLLIYTNIRNIAIDKLKTLFKHIRLSHLSFQNQIILYQMNLKYSTHTILSTWGFNPLPADCKKFPRTHRSDALLCVLWCKNAINNFSDHKNKIVCTILYQPLVIQLKLLNMLSHNDILKISLPFFFSDDIWNILAYLLHANKNILPADIG